jgi:hypothetical protein
VPVCGDVCVGVVWVCAAAVWIPAAEVCGSVLRDGASARRPSAVAMAPHGGLLRVSLSPIGFPWAGHRRTADATRGCRVRVRKAWEGANVHRPSPSHRSRIGGTRAHGPRWHALDSRVDRRDRVVRERVTRIETEKKESQNYTDDTLDWL